MACSRSYEKRAFRDGILEKFNSFTGNNLPANGRKSDKLPMPSRKKERNFTACFSDNKATYTAEQLMNKADMCDPIEAHINLTKRDLKLLALEIEHLIYR